MNDQAHYLLPFIFITENLIPFGFTGVFKEKGYDLHRRNLAQKNGMVSLD